MLIYIILAVLALLVIVNIIFTLNAAKKDSGNELTEIKNSISSLTQNLKDTEANLKGEFITNRSETAQSSKDLREEVGKQINTFTQTFLEQLTALTKSVEEKFVSFQTTIETNSKESRKELRENLEAFK